MGLEGEAKARRKEAKNVKTAGVINAMSSIVGAGSSMLDRYGEKAPIQPFSIPAYQPSQAELDAQAKFDAAIARSKKLVEEIRRKQSGSRIDPTWWRG